jgi:hypothetical protein
MSLPSSGSQREPNEKPCFLFYAGFLLGLLFDPEDGDNLFLGNVT